MCVFVLIIFLNVYRKCVHICMLVCHEEHSYISIFFCWLYLYSWVLFWPLLILNCCLSIGIWQVCLLPSQQQAWKMPLSYFYFFVPIVTLARAASPPDLPGTLASRDKMTSDVQNCWLVREGIACSWAILNKKLAKIIICVCHPFRFSLCSLCLTFSFPLSIHVWPMSTVFLGKFCSTSIETCYMTFCSVSHHGAMCHVQ